MNWAGGCWVVAKTGGATEITTEPSILNVWHEHGEDVQSILIETPIGLPQSGVRAWARETKKYLAGRGSTVFSIPSLEVVETDDYEFARALNGDSLGSQTWWLFPRIREVDVSLQTHPEAVDKIYESHLEVCFSAFAGNSLERKTTDARREERLGELHDTVEHLLDGQSLLNTPRSRTRS